MTETKEKKEVKEKINDSIKFEDRIDENGTQAFLSMGYKNRLSDNMVNIYKTFKRKKDALQPGRLSPEGFAFVAVLGELSDGNLKTE